MVENQENIIYFLVGIKTFEISQAIYNPIFTNNVNDFETLRQILPQL